jgi:Zinc finger, C2H2 type
MADIYLTADLLPSDNDDEFSWLKSRANSFDDGSAPSIFAFGSNTTSSILTPSTPPRRQAYLTDSDSDGRSSDSNSDFGAEPSSSDVERHRVFDPFSSPASPLESPQGPSSRQISIGGHLNAIWDPPSPSPLSRADAGQPRQQLRLSIPRNIQTVCDGASQSAVKVNPWECPHCPWVQRNKRTPDLKRHIRTHTRLLQPAQWVCRGILDDTPSSLHSDDSPPHLLGSGSGGCGKTFSRRDALKRHLDNRNIGCSKKSAS